MGFNFGCFLMHNALSWCCHMQDGADCVPVPHCAAKHIFLVGWLMAMVPLCSRQPTAGLPRKFCIRRVVPRWVTRAPSYRGASPAGLTWAVSHAAYQCVSEACGCLICGRQIAGRCSGWVGAALVSAGGVSVPPGVGCNVAQDVVQCAAASLACAPLAHGKAACVGLSQVRQQYVPRCAWP